MAQATVTMKVTPEELQHIDAALDYYAWSVKAIRQPSAKADVRIIGSDPRRCIMVAQKIRQDIGLKT